MSSNKTSSRDETDYMLFSPGATGLHHLHGHRPAAPTERGSGSLVVDLTSVRAGAPRSTKTDGASRTQVHGILLLLTVAALWGSYSPVLKFLFSQPHPPSAALMTAAQALLAAAFLMACSLGGGSGTTSAAAQRGGKAPGSYSAVAAASHSGRFKAGAPRKSRLHASLGLALNHAASWLRSALQGGTTAWQGLTFGVLNRRREGGRWSSYVLSKQQPLNSTLSGSRSSDCGTAGAISGETMTGNSSDLTQGPHEVLDAAGRGCSGGGGLHGHAGHSSRGTCSPGAIGEDEAPHASGRGSGGGGSTGTSYYHDKQMQDDGPLGRLPTSPPPSSCTMQSVAALQPLSGMATVSSFGTLPDAAEVAGVAGKGRGFRNSNLLTSPLSSLAAVGLELGTYSFCAAALGAWGVQRISATKVAFLGQASSLMTPLLLAVSGQRVALVVWGACCLGVMGAALVALDGASRPAAAAIAAASDATGGGFGATSTGASGLGILVPTHTAATASVGSGGAHVGVSRAMRLETGGADVSGSMSSASAHGPLVLGWMRHALPHALSRESQGTHYVLASCLFYALGTVRLGVHSGRFAPLDLASASALGYAGMAVVWLLAEVLGTPSGGSSHFAVLALLLGDNATLALVLWAGFGPGALSSYLQVLGQRIVPAAQAQMLYSSAPFWSALIAQILLQGRDDAMGPLAWLGGGVMLSASLLAALLDSRGSSGGSKKEPSCGMRPAVPAGTGSLAVAAMTGHGERRGGPALGSAAAATSSSSAASHHLSPPSFRWWAGGAARQYQHDDRNRDL